MTVGASINGVTVHTAVNVAFAAGDAGAGKLTSVTNIVMSYNNYYFNYTLPAISCTVVQPVVGPPAVAGYVTVPAVIIPIPILSFPNRASYSQKCQILSNTYKELHLILRLRLTLM